MYQYYKVKQMYTLVLHLHESFEVTLEWRPSVSTRSPDECSELTPRNILKFKLGSSLPPGAARVSDISRRIFSLEGAGSASSSLSVPFNVRKLTL